MRVRISRIQYVLFSLFGLILSCDSVSSHQGNEADATKKMKQKVHHVQTELKSNCDSNLYRQANRIADSIMSTTTSK